MKLPAFVPTPTEVVHYALLIVGASLVAMWVQKNLPSARKPFRRAGF